MGLSTLAGYFIWGIHKSVFSVPSASKRIKISIEYILALYFIFSAFSAISAVKILAGRFHGPKSTNFDC
jgi:hypothetical protein